jgi:proteasome lid subunit RPN8/RPN11
VLIGEPCEDDAGRYVNVKNIIRGTAAKEGGAHVTFTQETWNRIHEAKEQRFAKLHIVGWYHSHPGFGVEFSDMDLFIQRNFFAGDMQIALVADPVGGEEAICVNAGDDARGVRYVSRFWVDGRERRARRPATAEKKDRAAGSESGGETDAASGRESDGTPGGASGGGTSRQFMETLEALERRINQMLDATEEQRKTQNWVWMIIVLLVMAGITVWVSFTIREWLNPPRPPEIVGWVPVPIQIDGKWNMVGQAPIVKWEVPPQLIAMFEDAMRQKVVEEEAAKNKDRGQPSTQPTASPHP